MLSLATASNPVFKLLRRFTIGAPHNEALARSHSFFDALQQDKDLADYDFVVLDTELTGMNAKQDEIVSIGAVRIRNMSIAPGETYTAMVRPRTDMPKTATLIHRITPTQVENKPRLDAVLPDLVEFCENSLIVGHHVGMDMAFVNKASRKVLGAALLNPCIDTMRLAMVYEEEMWENYYDQYKVNVSYALPDLAKRYNLPQFPAHDALSDAMQTAYLFLFLAKKLRQGSIRTLKDLHEAGRGLGRFF